MSSDQSQSFAAAEGREFLAGELQNKEPKWVREFAGLVDDPDTLDLLNYYCSLWNDTDDDEHFLDTRLARSILRKAATETIDDAFRGGNISQLKGMTGLTRQERDGEDLLSDAAQRLEHEGSIGLVLGPPGSGKTALTLDVARIWKARAGGTCIGNTGWSGFDEVVRSDRDLLETMGHTQGPVLAVIDETAQELSGFGSSNKAAEQFSDALTFIRKREDSHGPHAKKGSVLMVNHTRKKTAKCFRDLASFALEKPSRNDPGRARLLDSEGGKDTFTEQYTATGITDTAETYSEHEASEFAVTGLEDDGDDQDDAPNREQIVWNQQARAAILAYYEDGKSYREVAKMPGIDYGKGWVGDRVKEYKDGDHRDLFDGDAPQVEQ